jgi:hypothetical protein
MEEGNGMMSKAHTTPDTSCADSAVQGARHTRGTFDVTLCGQCSTCQSYFPCEQIFALQIQNDNTYHDTGRLICFECQRGVMNPRAYQVRELIRDEVETALRRWLAQRHLLSEDSVSG